MSTREENLADGRTVTGRDLDEIGARRNLAPIIVPAVPHQAVLAGARREPTGIAVSHQIVQYRIWYEGWRQRGKTQRPQQISCE